MNEAQYQNTPGRNRNVEIWNRPIRNHKGGAAADPVVPLPWVSALVKSGNSLIVTPSFVYGIKRVLTEVFADTWKFAPRRATATCTVSAGAVNAVTVTDQGLAYITLPTVTCSPPPIPGVTAVLTPTLAATSGQIEGAYVTACGTLYATCTLVFDPPPVAPGNITATGVAVLRDGLLVGITMTSKGHGYTSVPNITITGFQADLVTPAVGATAVAVRGLGGITLAITTPGTLYVSPPTITIGASAQQPIPLPPTIAAPGGASWPDGLGWGVIQGGSLTGGLATSQAVLIVHDPRGMVSYGLMGDGAAPTVPYSRAPDSILSWYETLVRLSIADPLADGVLPAWVPMAGGL